MAIINNYRLKVFLGSCREISLEYCNDVNLNFYRLHFLKFFKPVIN